MAFCLCRKCRILLSAESVDYYCVPKMQAICAKSVGYLCRKCRLILCVESVDYQFVPKVQDITLCRKCRLLLCAKIVGYYLKSNQNPVVRMRKHLTKLSIYNVCFGGRMNVVIKGNNYCSLPHQISCLHLHYSHLYLKHKCNNITVYQ